MQRLLIAALGAAFVVSAAAPVLADDYPACTQPGQDHCRVVKHGWDHHHHRGGGDHHHHHGGGGHHHHHHAKH